MTDRQNVPATYNLIAVTHYLTNYNGRAGNAGHFWAEIKNPISKMWRVINDARVEAPTNKRSNAEISGYLLFY